MYKLAPRFHKLPGLIEMDLSHRCRPFSSCGRRERERNIDKHGHAFDGIGRLGRRAFGYWCSCHRCGLLACRSSTYDHVGHLHGSGVAHHKTKYLPPIQSSWSYRSPCSAIWSTPSRCVYSSSSLALACGEPARSLPLLTWIVALPKIELEQDV